MFPNNLYMSKIYSNFAGKIPSAEFTDIELALGAYPIQTENAQSSPTIVYTAQLLVLPSAGVTSSGRFVGGNGRYLFGDFCDRALALFEKHQNEIV